MALLHLAHPETFDPTVSADHKRWITSRFADVAGTSPDVDRRLLAARAALTPQYGEGLRLVRRLARAPVVEERQGLEVVPRPGWSAAAPMLTGPAPETAELLESGDETFLADGIGLASAGPGSWPDGAPSPRTSRSVTPATGCWPSSTSSSGTASGWAAPLRDRPEAYAAVRHLASLTERPPGGATANGTTWPAASACRRSPSTRLPRTRTTSPLARPLTTSRSPPRSSTSTGRSWTRSRSCWTTRGRLSSTGRRVPGRPTWPSSWRRPSRMATRTACPWSSSTPPPPTRTSSRDCGPR